MGTLVESLKRLYLKKRLTKQQIKDRVTKGTINESMILLSACWTVESRNAI